MQLKKLELQYFRNYEYVDVSFQPGVNVFLGENAQGKTSLMEAIHVLALARSHRTSNDRELIQWDQDFAKVKGLVESKYSTYPLELRLSPKGKVVKVNHIDQPKLSTFIGHLNMVLFAPEDLYLIKGPPANRRKFLDMEIGQLSAIYLNFSVDYQRVLKQRNAYLKKLMLGKVKDYLYLDVLTDQLIELAAEILIRRLDFLKELEKWAKEIHYEISSGTEILEIFYLSRIQLKDGLAKESFQEAILTEANRVREREIERGTTLFGPHRDDFTAHINGRDVQKFGSQGQQRTTVLSLKLAEIELMNEEMGEYPVLLLDDVLSELDQSRQTHLLKSIESKVQTFLTTPSLNDIQKEKIQNPSIFTIVDGSIQEE